MGHEFYEYKKFNLSSLNVCYIQVVSFPRYRQKTEAAKHALANSQ